MKGKLLFSILTIILLITACGSTKENKNIDKLEGHFIESGIKANNVTNEKSDFYKDDMNEFEAVAHKYYRYELIFDEGEFSITVFDLKKGKNEDTLKDALKMRWGLDDKVQLYINNNLVMVLDGGSIEAIDAHETVVVKTFKAY